MRRLIPKYLSPWSTMMSPSAFGIPISNEGKQMTPDPEWVAKHATLAASAVKQGMKRVADLVELLGPDDVLKRTVEAAMRTTSEPNPIPRIKENIISMWNGGDGGRARMWDIIKYILSGYKSGPPGWSNSFAYLVDDNYPNQYTGFWNGKDNPRVGKVADAVDAYLYGVPIDRSWKMYKIPGHDYGVLTDYVKENYPNKDIPIYGVSFGGIPEGDVIQSTIVNNEASGDIDTGKYLFNAAGHRRLTAKTKDGHTVHKDIDIWKFNPEDYSKKWFDGEGDFLTNLGLHVVDYLGTPFITLTGWYADDKDYDIPPNGI